VRGSDSAVLLGTTTVRATPPATVVYALCFSYHRCIHVSYWGSGYRPATACFEGTTLQPRLLGKVRVGRVGGAVPKPRGAETGGGRLKRP
jgi:hypothetical protein